MVMKDKLSKHNHKFVYFVMRRFSLFLLVAVGLAGAISVTTYISLSGTPATSGRAENISESSNPDSTSSETSLDY